LVNVNPGGSQWPHPNLIGYDALNSFGSPSYYAQVMFASNRGTVCLPATVDGAPRLAYSVTREERTKIVYIKIVNPTASAQPVAIALNGVAEVMPEGEASVLTSADRQDRNSLAQPRKVVPITSPLRGLDKDFSYTLAPYSFTVLRVSTK